MRATPLRCPARLPLEHARELLEVERRCSSLAAQEFLHDSHFQRRFPGILKKPTGQTERLWHRSELAFLPGSSVLYSSGVNIGWL